MEKYKLTWDEIFERIKQLKVDESNNIVYGVPKGGMIVAGFLEKAKITHNPFYANVILDDIIDSGKTMEFYKKEFPKAKFLALYDKYQDEPDLSNYWVEFPWETEHPAGEESVQQNIIRTLQYIGEDVGREGLKGTPDRIVKSWDEIFSGYSKKPEDVLTMFEADGYDEIVLLKDIELYSTCEHHMLPFYGKAHVAYIPKEKVIGISKLARLVDIYARRLQIQERIAQQVTEALMTHLNPLGAACIIEAEHMCMRMRGVNKQNSVMTTSSMKGVFLTKAEARMELMQLIKG